MLMLFILSFHIITMVAWFAGLFYLPRLFVYHTNATDSISIERFKVMEHKLYYYIMTPAGILTTLLGIWLLSYNFAIYLQFSWMHVKLVLVLLLWVYHIYCGRMLSNFKHERNRQSAKFFRIFNEFPTVLLIAIVIMVVVKP